MTQVTALCTCERSAFTAIAQCYGITRNALTWRGGSPVVAMPPCAQWSRLRRFARPDIAGQWLGVWCTAQVRAWGGVIEQPSSSTLWAACDIPRPGYRDTSGYTIEVDQHLWGHPARKRTWLYIVGVAPGSLPPMPPPQLGQPRDLAASLSHRQRIATPPAFAIWLVTVASRVTTAGPQSTRVLGHPSAFLQSIDALPWPKAANPRPRRAGPLLS